MTTKELIKQVLEKWRFPILQENDNCLVFRYQMSYIQANITGSEDSDSVVLTLTGIFSADDAKEMFIGLRTCNDLNYNLLQVKLYIDSDADLIIASEFFYKTEADMEYLLTMALQSIIVAKKRFAQKYSELEEEAKLISELEQE
ncbi:MAG: hypothetical protein K2I69_07425 [Muribaculaceae bacterium]|nr:hypothetical protein [Muribaculaceae bacterium]